MGSVLQFVEAYTIVVTMECVNVLCVLTMLLQLFFLSLITIDDAWTGY